MWSKVLAGVVAIAASAGTVSVWALDAYKHFEKTADHNEDIAKVLELIAEEKKFDRVQRNQRELQRLERDLVGGKYANEDEKTFIILEIKDLKSSIRCDVEGICDKD